MRLKRVLFGWMVFYFSWGLIKGEPAFFRFQARATDRDGEPRKNVEIDLRFEIYDQPDGGNKIWPVKAEDGDGLVSKLPTNASGLFSAEVGPFSNTLFEAGKSYYLQILINDFGYQPLKPRQKLDWVPFAIHAAGADTVANNAVGTSQLVDGSVTDKKIAASAVGSDQLQIGAVKAWHLSTDTIKSESIVNGSIANEDLADAIITPEKIDKESFKVADLTFVPKGAVFMFLELCPDGYTEVIELRNRVPMGADSSGADLNIPNEAGKTGGTETHLHTIEHNHVISEAVKFGQSKVIYAYGGGSWAAFDPSNEGYLVESAANSGDTLTEMKGHRHIHNIATAADLESGQATHLPPFLTVYFCKKN